MPRWPATNLGLGLAAQVDAGPRGQHPGTGTHEPAAVTVAGEDAARRG